MRLRNCVVECVSVMRADKQEEALFTPLGLMRRCLLLPLQTDRALLQLHLLLVELRTFIFRCLFFSMPRGRRQSLRKCEKVVKYKVQFAYNKVIVLERHLKVHEAAHSNTITKFYVYKEQNKIQK